MQRFAICLVASSALALGACAKKAPEELPPAPVATTSPAPAPAPQGAQPGSQAHFSQAMRGADTIYFDTDMYDIDSQDAVALRQQAEYLLQYSSAGATVQGHADERGTREYNLALGERRANAAKNYLVSLGVADSRLRTVSHGEERPVALGSDEASWAQNRRAVTVMID